MRVNQFSKYLKIQKPFTIKLVTKKNPKHAAAYWTLSRNQVIMHSHLIHVYLECQDNPAERNIETLIAHELIHAWQAENNIVGKRFHCREFIKMARKMEKEFGLPRLYDKKLDIT